MLCWAVWKQGMRRCAQVDWRGDGGPEYDAAGLEAPVLSESARAAQARAAEGPPSHTLQECLEVCPGEFQGFSGPALMRVQGLF